MTGKIPSKATFDFGAKLLGEIADEIDKQVGKELESTDGKVNSEEVAQFLRQRGGLSSTSGAAVAALQAYMRKVTGSSEVPLTAVKETLAKVSGYVEKHRAQGKAMDELPATWRAIGLLAEEAKTKGLDAKQIVSDRSTRPVGNQKQLAKAAVTLGGLFDQIRSEYGGGELSVDAVKTYLAEGSESVSTAKSAVRRITRYLEQRTKQTSFTKDDVTAVLDDAMTAFKKNAAGSDDRAKLARTWQSIAAFSDENALRKKDATSLAKREPKAADTPAVEDGGPKANSVAGFLALDTDTKANILEDYGDLMGHYESSGEMSLDALPEGSEAEKFALAMKKELRSIVGDCEDDSGIYGFIGGPEIDVEVVSLPSGEIVGGRISMFQRGFNTDDRADGHDEDDYEYHYDTKAEVEAAGFDPDDDISWSVHGLFQVDGAGGAAQLGEYQHVSDYWEWSGY